MDGLMRHILTLMLLSAETLFICLPGFTQTLVFNEITLEEPTILDEDGEWGKGWIELKNLSATPATTQDLAISLNDSLVWPLPHLQVGPGQFLFVWLSGKNRFAPVLHTSFVAENRNDNVFKLINHQTGKLKDSVLVSGKLDWTESLNRFGEEWIHVTNRTPLAENQRAFYWERMLANAPFLPRDSAPTASVYFNDKFWILSGWTGDSSNPNKEVWYSSDMRVWNLATAEGPFEGDANFVVFQGKMWAFDGDAYTSTNGQVWEKVAEELPFSPAARVIVFQDTLWAVKHRSVFKSHNGTHWQTVTEEAPWPNRELPGFQGFNGKLWLFGGAPYHQAENAAYRDVWASADGLHWTKEADTAAFPSRSWFGTAIFDNKMWMLGGWDYFAQDDVADVWFTEDGIHWEQFVSTAHWTARHAPYVWTARDALWIGAGYYTLHSGLLNDIWRLSAPDHYLPKHFYLKKDSLINKLSSWSSNPDGSGVAPSCFHNDQTTYHILGDSNRATDHWMISGFNSQLKIGSGTDKATLTIDKGINVTARIFLKDKAKLTVHGPVVPEIVEAQAGSMVEVDSTSFVSVMARELGSLRTSVDTLMLAHPLVVKDTFNLHNAIVLQNAHNLQYAPEAVLRYSGPAINTDMEEARHESGLRKIVAACDSALIIHAPLTVDSLFILKGRVHIDSGYISSNHIVQAAPSQNYIVMAPSTFLDMPTLQDSTTFPVGTLNSYNPVRVWGAHGRTRVAISQPDSLTNLNGTLNLFWHIQSDSLTNLPVKVSWELTNQPEGFLTFGAIVRVVEANWTEHQLADTIKAMTLSGLIDSSGTFTVRDISTKSTGLAQKANEDQIIVYPDDLEIKDRINISSGLDFSIYLDSTEITSVPIQNLAEESLVVVIKNDGNDFFFPLVDTLQIVIVKYPLKVAAIDTTITYGSPIANLQMKFSGFLQGDSMEDLLQPPTATTPATSVSEPGVYPISPGGGWDTKYTFEYVPGTLTIGKRPLTVTARDTSRLFATDNPTFDLRWSGFVNGDTPSSLDEQPHAETTAGYYAEPGSYPINVYGGSDRRYQYNFVPGNLEVALPELTTFPNPAVNVLFIAAPSEIKKVEIFDSTGRLSLSTEYAGVKVLQVDLSHLLSGVYWTSIWHQGGLVQKKIVISR